MLSGHVRRSLPAEGQSGIMLVFQTVLLRLARGAFLRARVSVVLALVDGLSLNVCVLRHSMGRVLGHCLFHAVLLI